MKAAPPLPKKTPTFIEKRAENRAENEKLRKVYQKSRKIGETAEIAAPSSAKSRFQVDFEVPSASQNRPKMGTQKTSKKTLFRLIRDELHLTGAGQ